MNSILINNLKVNNANAFSAPYTVGFPSITAFMGASHCLERHLKERGHKKIKFKGLAVVSHKFDLGVYKDKDFYVHRAFGKSWPLKKDGARKPIIENPRCSMEISLLIKFSGVKTENLAALESDIKAILLGKMKIAGGDIMAASSNKIKVGVKDLQEDFYEIRRALMPGYVLIERSDLVRKTVKEKNCDHLDAILDHLVIKHACFKTEGPKEDEPKFDWLSYKESEGWIIPICTGYHSLTKPGRVKMQRSNDYDHMFVESVLTLGEFGLVYRIRDFNSILWKLDQTKLNDNLYTFTTKE